MPIQVESLRETIRHSLGGEPAPGGSYARIINGAGRAFMAAHDWYWASNRDAVITSDGTEWVELPDDFGGLNGIWQDGSYYESVHITTAKEFLEWRERASGLSTPYPFLGTLQVRTDVDEGTKPWLRLFPEPTTSDTYRILYDAAWTVVDDDTDTVALPSFVEPAFEEFVRAYALGLNEEDMAPLSVRIQALKEGELFKDACRRDALTTGASIPSGRGAASEYNERSYIRIDLEGA